MTVQMQRGDQLADVHPDEVGNYSVGGWSLCEDQSENLVSVYKLTDGERGNRASKTGMTRADAEGWIADHPDDEYEMVDAD